MERQDAARILYVWSILVAQRQAGSIACLGVAVDGAGLKTDKLFGFFAAGKFSNHRLKDAYLGLLDFIWQKLGIMRFFAAVPSKKDCQISSKKVYKTEIPASWWRWPLGKWESGKTNSTKMRIAIHKTTTSGSIPARLFFVFFHFRLHGCPHLRTNLK